MYRYIFFGQKSKIMSSKILGTFTSCLYTFKLCLFARSLPSVSPSSEEMRIVPFPSSI